MWLYNENRKIIEQVSSENNKDYACSILPYLYNNQPVVAENAFFFLI